MIASVDIGTKNLGYAIWDSSIVDFGVVDLTQFKKGKDYAAMAKALCDTGIFDECDTILIERQMQARMKVLATALRCFFWDKAVLIAPQSVKRHFKSGTKKHSTNKKKAVDIVAPFIKDLDKFKALRKKDDVADAILQVLYYVRSRTSTHIA